MDKKLELLQEDLRALHRHHRDETHEQYQRINPFMEDLFDWKERGAYWPGAGKDVTIYNSTTVVGDVTIGDHTWIGPYCSLDGGGGLKIGSHCSISLGCQFISHDSAKWALSGGKEGYEYAPIEIGDNCYFGSYVVVPKGKKIGKHCLIAAGCVVTKDVPDYSIVAGVPGKVIGKVVLENGKVTLEYFE